MSESNEDFIKRVGAVCEAAQEPFQQALDWLDVDATKAEAFDMAEVAKAHDTRMKAIEAFRTALPEALERLAAADAECDRLRTEAANKDAQLDDLETAVEELEDATSSS